MLNAFTVDVEDYFQVEAFANIIDKTRWADYPVRVEKNTYVLLELLDENETKGTFFVLGWIAQRYPELIREIAHRGHEIASHGMSHRLVYTQSPEEFRAETRQSKQLLEDIVQRSVLGYRAATYSITEQSLWAMDIIAEEGFLYDSSIFPVRHDKYGIPDANRLPHKYKTSSGAGIVEFPISVLKLGSFNLPIGGGGYFRLFPYPFSRWALNKVNTRQNSFVFYLHPWEVDPDQPRIKNATTLSKFRHYLNLSKNLRRLDQLIGDFRFSTMQDVLHQMKLLPSVAQCRSDRLG